MALVAVAALVAGLASAGPAGADEVTPVVVTPEPGRRLLTAVADPGDDEFGGVPPLTYTEADAEVEARDVSARSVTVTARDQFTLRLTVQLQVPAGQELVPGTYVDGDPIGDHGPQVWLTSGGLACGNVTGSFTILAYDRELDGSVAYLHATYERHCFGHAASARGEVIIDNRPVDRRPVTFDHASLSFSGAPWPAGAVAQSVVVTNPGPASLHVGAVSFTGHGYSATADGCSAQTLTAGASCTVQVTFRTAYPGVHTGRLQVPTDAGWGLRTVELTGEMDLGGARTPRAMLTVESDPKDPVGQGATIERTAERDDVSVTLGNRSFEFRNDLEPGSYESLELLGGSDGLVPGFYPLAGTTHDSPPGPGLTWGRPSAGCTNPSGSFTVRAADAFADGSPAYFLAEFEQHCNGGSAASRGVVIVDRRPEQTVGLDVSSRLLDFGDVMLPARAPTQSLTFVNTAAVPVALGTVSLTSTAFAVSGDGCSRHTLAVGGSCQLDVGFVGNTAVRRQGALRLANDGPGGTVTVGLVGTVSGPVEPRSFLVADSDGREPYLRTAAIDFEGGVDALATATSTEAGRRVSITVQPVVGPRWDFAFHVPSGHVVAPGSFAGQRFGTDPEGRWFGADTPALCFDSSSAAELLALDRREDGTIRYLHARFQQQCLGYRPVRGEVVIDDRTFDELTGGARADLAALSFPGSPWPHGSVPQTVVITNTASIPILIGAARTTSDEFVIGADGCSAHTVPAGGSCSVGVRFAADLPGTRRALLVVPASGAEGGVAIDLSGVMDAGTRPVPQHFLDMMSTAYNVPHPGQVERHVPEGGTLEAKMRDAQLVVKATEPPLTGFDTSTWAVQLGAADGAPLAVGSYAVATSYPIPGLPFLAVSPPIPDCPFAVGSFAIYALDLREDGTVRTAHGSFDTFCENGGERRGEFWIDERRISEIPVPAVADQVSISFAGTRWSAGDARRVVTVSNPSTVPVPIGQAWADGGPFWIEDDHCSATVLAPGGSCRLTTVFDTPADGTFAGELVVPAASDAVRVALSGSMTFGDLGRFHPLTPRAVFDSSTGLGRARKRTRLVGGVAEQPSVLGTPGLPSSGVDAVFVQVTVTGATKAGSLNLTLPDLAAPWTAQAGRSMVYPAGSSVSSLVTVPLSALERYRIVATSAVHVRLDLVGYLGDGSADGGLALEPVGAQRVLSTGEGVGTASRLRKGRVTAGAVSSMEVADGPVIAVVTTYSATTGGKLKLWTSGARESTGLSIPVASNEERSTTMVLVPGSNGRVDVRMSSGSVMVRIDIVGRWHPAPDTNWAGRLLVTLPAPVRIVEIGGAHSALLPGARSVADIAQDFVVPVDVGVMAVWRTTGVVGTVSTSASASNNGIRLSGEAGGSPYLLGVAHTARPGKGASNFGLWPLAEGVTPGVVNIGGPTSFSFDQLGVVVDEFLGYAFIDAAQAAVAGSRLGPSATPDPNPAMVIKAVKRVL